MTVEINQRVPKRVVRGVRAPAPPGHFVGSLGGKDSAAVYIPIEDIAGVVFAIMQGKPAKGQGGSYGGASGTPPVSTSSAQYAAMLARDFIGY